MGKLLPMTTQKWGRDGYTFWASHMMRSTRPNVLYEVDWLMQPLSARDKAHGLMQPQLG